MNDAAFRRLVRIGLAAVAFPVLGCAREPEYGFVEGVVTRDGRPLEEVQVRFVPSPDHEFPGGYTAQGLTDANGRYRLYTGLASKQGAIVGRHRVCVIDANDFEATGKRIPPAYYRTSQTPLGSVEVRPGDQIYDIAIDGSAVEPAKPK